VAQADIAGEFEGWFPGPDKKKRRSEAQAFSAKIKTLTERERLCHNPARRARP
jgi:hypothetical protein